jgi:guanylate kinase
MHSPSGAGKSAILNELFKFDDKICKLPSFTTRPLREGEKEGYDYFFISKEEFAQKLAAGDILEYMEYYGNRAYYGTLTNKVKQALEKDDKDLFFILDLEGIGNLRKAFPE